MLLDIMFIKIHKYSKKWWNYNLLKAFDFKRTKIFKGKVLICKHFGLKKALQALTMDLKGSRIFKTKLFCDLSL